MRYRVVVGFLLVGAAACASRGGYAEPGPASASANPPSPHSVQSGQPLQPSPGNGRTSAIPPMVGLTGNNIPASPSNDDTRGECRTDADCAPAACCHPTACTSHTNMPRCANIMCTQQCVPGTLDCGQASCVCLGGRCGVQRRG